MMMMRIIMESTLAIALLMMIGLASTGIANAQAQTQIPAKAKFLTYENPDFNFKINYFSNWTKQEANLPANSIVGFSDKNESENISRDKK